MTEDIVGRLRGDWCLGNVPSERKEAADEIERLRDDLRASKDNADALIHERARLRAALELFIVTVNPPHPQSMALWQEHLKAATKTAHRALKREK
jgi:hypothetical protein